MLHGRDGDSRINIPNSYRAVNEMVQTHCMDNGYMGISKRYIKFMPQLYFHYCKSDVERERWSVGFLPFRQGYMSNVTRFT